ncbi:MAG: hypothetical protein VZQ98_14980 [Bacteroidales bacterium]|nr:hypothetical protein [Bacteroidales bacterium]
MGNCCVNIIVNYSCKSSLCNKWTVTGKVSDVIRTAGSQKPDLHFDYDAMGQRIAKTVTNKNTTDGTDKFVMTYYVRDPQGNVLEVYEHKHGDSGNGTFTLTEQHLYGASRLGMKKRDLALNVANASESTPVTHYELINHLGNVMAVISDEASTTDKPTVVSLSDYYPFGMTMPGRSYDAGYRYGFQGQDRERELWGGEASFFKYRISDNRLGRFFSVDPLSSKFPWNSSYAFSENRLIDGVEMEGLEYVSAADFGENNLKGTPTVDHPYYYSFEKYRDPKTLNKIFDKDNSGLVCYESCLVCYARGNDVVAKYLSEKKIPLNRADAYNRFFPKGGEYLSFLKPTDSDIKKVGRGDIMFKGEPGPNQGHAVIVLETPKFISETKFEIRIIGAYVYGEFNEKTYTFIKENGKWKDESSDQYLVGFGRVDEAGLMEKYKNSQKNLDDQENDKDRESENYNGDNDEN